MKKIPHLRTFEEEAHDRENKYYILQLSTEKELNRLASLKFNPTITVIDLQFCLPRKTVAYAQYMKYMREEFSIDLVIRTGEWRHPGNEEFKFDLVSKEDGVIYSGVHMFAGEFINEAIPALEQHENYKMRTQGLKAERFYRL